MHCVLSYRMASMLGVVLAGTGGTADGESLDLFRGIPLDARLGVINVLIIGFGTRCWCWQTRGSAMVAILEGATELVLARLMGTAKAILYGKIIATAWAYY